MSNKLKYYGVAAMLLTVLLAAGCHGSRRTAGTDGVTSVTTTPAEPEAETVQPRYTLVNFDATVDGVRASGQLRVARDSAIWLSVNKFIELGRGLATTDSVWFNAPLLDRRFAGSYADLRRMTRHDVSFAKLQAIALGDSTEAEVARIAAMMGIEATVSITSRRTADKLTFPFQKFQSTQ